MTGTTTVLPAEIWNHVFRYLSAGDKLSVRACSRYFKKLIDHRSLWKNCSVVLVFKKHAYNSQFWATLRRREVTTVVVRSSKAKGWKELSLSLPALTTIIIEHGSQFSLLYLKDFTNLERLIMRHSSTTRLPDASMLCQPQQLTHLTMCDVKYPATTTEGFISAVSQFTELTSLVLHNKGSYDKIFWMVRSILARMHKLKHLSLSAVPILLGRPPPDPGPFDASSLSILELINCTDHTLPENAMKLMPDLKSLSVYYKQSNQEMAERWTSPTCHLKTWLSDLPHLSTLVIVKGPPINTYVTSIPSTVTSLTICVAGLSSGDMATISKQVPNLLHLHIETQRSHLGALTARIPHFFPKLKSLKLCLEHVEEKYLLELHQLQDLEYLEILDNISHLPELSGKLRALTHDRFQISRRKTDVLSCVCSYI